PRPSMCLNFRVALVLDWLPQGAPPRVLGHKTSFVLFWRPWSPFILKLAPRIEKVNRNFIKKAKEKPIGFSFRGMCSIGLDGQSNIAGVRLGWSSFLTTGVLGDPVGSPSRATC